MQDKTESLRRAIAQPQSMLGPGVFDGLSARIATRAGFDFVHASGGAIARSIGYPDTGLVTMTEMLSRITEIVEATELPTVADADTGYGDATNAARCAQAYRRAGVAALHIEDQVFPKRCGHFDGVAVIPTLEMIDKIKAMKDSIDNDVLVIARTDATKIEGVAASIDRMGAYLEAGADVAFVEAIDTPETLEQVGTLPGPKMFNYARSAEGAVFAMDRLAELGFRLVIYPSDLQRAAIAAMDLVAAELRRSGHSGDVRDQLCSSALRDGLVERPYKARTNG